MPELFENAVQSIQLGVEDFEAKDPRRALSAIRNFHSGVVLLAKEVLVRAVPNSGESEVIAAHYKPVPDGSGGVKYEAMSAQTIDLNTIARRFKDFGLSIDHAALKELRRVRNDVEHRYSKEPHDAVRQVIAKAFPVAAQLFRLAHEDPRDCLGDAWETMLEVRTFYENEISACRITFDRVEWRSRFLDESRFDCPKCHSHLVEQKNPMNQEQEDVQAHCRSCGADITAETLVQHGLSVRMEWRSYVAMTDGDESPLQNCPECGLDTYLMSEEEIGCAWCGYTLAECARCMTGLMPGNIDPDNHSLCSYCGHLLSKDD